MEADCGAVPVTKRTVYNNYADKDALFSQIMSFIIAYAADFARGLREEFTTQITAAEAAGRPRRTWACFPALGILRPEVIAVRAS